jgi:spore germination protein YaaH
MNLGLQSTHANLLASAAQVLDDGFDGVHYDFEPIADGDTDLLSVLRKTHTLTQQRHGVLSVSAIHNEPWQGMAACLAALPASLALWSGHYLHQVALEVDQVAVMTYDTTLPTQATYGGYVRRATEAALQAIPAQVAVFIGIPAYHDENLYHHQRAETVAAALRGVRLALGDRPPHREFGVATYVDFTATARDWSDYQTGWTGPQPAGG